MTPATLANTFSFILQGSALADLKYGGRFYVTLCHRTDEQTNGQTKKEQNIAIAYSSRNRQNRLECPAQSVSSCSMSGNRTNKSYKRFFHVSWVRAIVKRTLLQMIQRWRDDS